MADFNIPTSNLAPLWGGLDVISPRSFAPENYSPWATVWRCLRDPAFSRFGIVPACDRQTDRQTERHTTTAYTALVLSRAVTIVIIMRRKTIVHTDQRLSLNRVRPVRSLRSSDF